MSGVIKGKNDICTVFPAYAEEWDYDKNRDIKPDEISCGSMTIVWWKCKKGHGWLASPNNR